MDHSNKNTIDLDELSKLFRDVKFNHASVNEKFDVELFTLGYLSALQTLHGVNKINSNLQDLISLRNLEADGKITRQDKLQALAEIIKLTQNTQNPSQITSIRILPEKLSSTEQRSPKKLTGQESPTSQAITPKRSKSNEGKNLVSSEKGTATGSAGQACSICANKMKGLNYAKLQSCGHCFHDSCLKTHLQKEINTKTFPIRCPVETCGREIEPTFLQTKLDAEHAKKFWDYAFARNLKRPDIGYSWCPTQGCKYFYMAPKPMLMMFRCPLCQKHYCLNCRAEYHRGQTCETYQKSHGVQTPKLDKDIIRFKQCPKCQKWVEYQKGNRIHCSCNHEFCVNCGENPSKCDCEVIRDVQGANRTPSGSEDLTEETHLYKMIMKDQEDEIARIKGTYQERPPEETKDKDANKFGFQTGKSQYS